MELEYQMVAAMGMRLVAWMSERGVPEVVVLIVMFF
jgi:hypothetical protein